MSALPPITVIRHHLPTVVGGQRAGNAKSDLLRLGCPKPYTTLTSGHQDRKHQCAAPSLHPMPNLLACDLGVLGVSDMAIILDASDRIAFAKDRLSGTTRTNVIDRWIYVFTAASFIAIVLAGFVPDSLAKVAAINAGQSPPFPPVLHVHAILMGTFLLLLLGQTILVATGKCAWHMQLGIAAMVLTPLIVITGFILAPTIYHSIWNAAQAAPPPVKQRLQQVLLILDDILLVQIRAGMLFALFMWVALRSRTRDPGLHKRMILLAVAAVLGAAIDRIDWLPSTMPGSPAAMDFFTVLAFSPMFIWDLARNRGIHRAYLIWVAFYLPVSVVVYAIWNTPFWHATARHIMGV